jgi:hypothetical protein
MSTRLEERIICSEWNETAFYYWHSVSERIDTRGETTRRKTTFGPVKAEPSMLLMMMMMMMMMMTMLYAK